MLILAAVLSVLSSTTAPTSRSTLALVGATLIDVSHAGHTHADIRDSVVLISRGRIVRAGDRRHTPIPPGTKIVDIKGEYLVPGLIDGYGAIRNQAFADAYLYEGVTTVMAPTAPANASVDGEAKVFRSAAGPSVIISAPISGYSPSGDILKASPWVKHRSADVRLDDRALKIEIENAEAKGARVIAADQDVWPDQLDLIVSEAHRRGLAVTAQLAFATYPQALHAGVDAFTRNDRYSLAVSPPEAFEAYADDPQGPGAKAAVRAVCSADLLSARIEVFGRQLSNSKTALMPILSMEATADDIGGPDPWTMRSAAFVTSADLDDPVDPKTGARPYLDKQPQARERIQNCARNKQAIDRQLHALGAVYLAGTATPSYGVIPGGGLHGELHLLHDIGLTPREALAAATSNLADALRLSDRGQLEPGRRADLVVLSADPRQSIEALSAISAVMVEGRFVNRDALLAAAKARHPA